MPTVTAGSVPPGGAEVQYQVDGSGPHLVLVPGTGPDANITWGHLVPGFADDHTVVRMDFADLSTADGEVTIEVLAEQVAAVITATAAGPVDLVGFSMGAVVCAVVAATRPELVRQLVVIGGWTCAEDPYLRNLFRAWRRAGDLDVEVFARIGTMTAFSPGFMSVLGTEQVEGLVSNTHPAPKTLRELDLILATDIRAHLPNVRAETLVIGSTQDRTIPVANTRELHAAIPGSGYVEIDSGHVVLFEAAEQITKLIRDHCGQ